MQRSFSLRRTLAVRFSLTMFVALLGLALLAYFGVRQALMQQLDESLRDSARFQAANILALGKSGSPNYSRDYFVRDANRFVAVRDSTGRILTSSTEGARTLPLQAGAFAQSRQTGFSLSSHQWHGRNFRSIYLAIPKSTFRPPAVVQVGASLAPLQTALHTILLEMLGMVLLALLATAIGAGWLAGSAVAPVRLIAEQASVITGEIGGQQITAHANVSEFHYLIEVLNAMVARLERACRWHRRIIRDLGHDLRTPVTALRASVEFALLKDRTPGEYRQILASTTEDIDRLSLICDALVLLGRLQAGEVTLDLREIDAGAVAREAIEGAELSPSGHSIELVESGEPVVLRADRRFIRMILDQLLDNARRYTPPGSHIRVAVHGEAREAVIAVEDNGSGLTDEVLPHLFEPFYRSDTARGREGGPGLGLTATAAVVTLHGGTVSASRGSEGGLRVVVRIPRSPTPDRKRAVPDPLLRNSPAGKSPIAPLVTSAKAWLTKA